MGLLRTGWTFAALLSCFATIALALAPVSYRRHLLYELACDADVVVRGKISGVGTSTFDVSVDEHVAGAAVAREITVERFKNWTCASRWTSYAKGQRVWLFLHTDAKSQRLQIMGAGGEGEMPMLDDDVLVRGYRARGFDDGEWDAGGTKVRGVRISSSEFGAAVRGVREALICRPSKWRVPFESVAPRASMEAVGVFARSSLLARHLIDEARSASEWRGPAQPDGVVVEMNSLHLLAMRSTNQGKDGDTRTDGDAVDFGDVCAWLGDVDGDGIDDIASGAPRDSKIGHFHGAMSILFLNGDGTVRKQREIREGVGGFTETMDEFSSFGEAIAPLGDLNGDGVPDVAVGASMWPEFSRWRGGVWVLFLNQEGGVARAVEIGSSRAMTDAGFGDNYGLGSALAYLGDLDGDGAVELAIGCDPKFDFGQDQGRSIFLASIGPSGDVTRARHWNAREQGFSDDSTWLGSALAAMGDVDGDGVSEVAIADTYDEDGGSVRGAVWIVFLTREGSIRDKRKISNWAGGFEGAMHDWELFGQALAGPGDVDRDGIADLLVGSATGVWTLLLTPEGEVKAHRKLAVDIPKNEFGRSLSVTRSSDPDGVRRVLCSGRLPNRSGFIASFAIGADGSLLAR